MNIITITTGYMGSGSSAITDFLSEFDDYRNSNGDFEYILLHCPDGLFDLEDKLLRGNNVVRSDEALHRFLKCVNTLYDTKNFWPGMYKRRVSTEFRNISYSFVDSLSDFKHNSDVYWYYQQIPKNFFLQIKNYFNRLAGLVSIRHAIGGRKPVLRYKGMRIAYPSNDKFYSCAKSYLNEFYKMLGYEQHNLLLDQFLLPHNLFRINNYFDDSVRVIVVERDPRDVFVLNKYKWLKDNCPVAYPIDVKDFCEYYKKMRDCEVKIKDNKILRICFEDLIYEYEATASKICEFLNLKQGNHVCKYQKFNPTISINNTQVYKKYTESLAETKYIDDHLGEYLYRFPYDVDVDVNKCF